MNKRRILYYLLNFVGLIIFLGIITAIYTNIHNDMRKFYLSIGIAGVAILLFIILYISYNFGNKALKERWFKYLLCMPDEQPDFSKDLELTQNNFDSDNDQHKNEIAKPEFRGAKKLCDYKVLKNGKICYGCIVEANQKIFKMSSFVHQVLPAVVVYSFDEYYSQNPMELKAIAKALFENRNSNFLKNEYNYFLNILLEDNLTQGRKVFATTMLLYRYHLPLGGLPSENLVVPVVTNPSLNSSVFVVDSKYWSKNIVAHYLEDVKKRTHIYAEREVSSDKVDEIFGINSKEEVNIIKESINNGTNNIEVINNETINDSVELSSQATDILTNNIAVEQNDIKDINKNLEN